MLHLLWTYDTENALDYISPSFSVTTDEVKYTKAWPNTTRGKPASRPPSHVSAILHEFLQASYPA